AAGARLGARQLCANLPGGWKFFRAIEGLYPAAPNNAILGAEAGHPFLETCFRLMAELPEAERVKRFRLGTHLLQRAVAAYDVDAHGEGAHNVTASARATTRTTSGAASPPPRRDLRVFPPPHFYPLGPEISAHWFKPGTAAHLDDMLRPE